MQNILISALKFSFLLIVLSWIAGCAFFSPPTEEQKLDDLFHGGETALRSDRLRQARENFQQIEEQYPFSRYRNYIMLALAYVYYEEKKFLEADVKLNQYIRDNPTSANLDYAYFMKGLVAYNTAVDTVNIFIQRNRSDKDPQLMINSFEAFKTLIRDYPNSRYTPVAQQYIVLLRNILSLYEVRVADFYMRRGAYVAVVNRSKYILEHYPGTQYTPHALTLLVVAYNKLGLNDLAVDMQEVLDLNYPNFDARINRANKQAKKSLLQRAKEMSDTLLEQIKVKPRY